MGYLLKKGELQKEDVGVIEVKDTTSYVAVSRNKVNAVLRKLQNEKLKGKKSKNGSCLLSLNETMLLTL
ncbi:DbpA RNA binding domain-containing protein [Chryseobacterium capnotolerans]|uniref:DbpA RNA binding domain-containing protein n=1 Tax=Chryseobacterium capnotolerans TaxID=2759528 RepID=UPI001E4E6DBB|nr:DbpA RNA binding domain-containing protein [Chryseobacterium capnotolerans]